MVHVVDRMTYRTEEKERNREVGGDARAGGLRLGGAGKVISSREYNV